MDFSGIGSDALRLIPARPGQGMDLAELEKAIEADRRAGFTPFLVVGTAGSVDTGAIDDLDALADLSRREQLWFHVDGACGALAVLAPDLAPRLRGIERADSLAFDFHKWGQVPYDAGFILVRDGCCTARPSPPPPLTCAAKSGDWRAAQRGPATLDPISRAASAR